ESPDSFDSTLGLAYSLGDGQGGRSRVSGQNRDAAGHQCRRQIDVTRGGFMSAPSTSTEFLELIRQSGLLNASRLEASLKRLRGPGLPEQPTALASAMMQDGLLSNFQAEQLLQGRSRGFAL